jgi:hypothetical protein
LVVGSLPVVTIVGRTIVDVTEALQPKLIASPLFPVTLFKTPAL